MSGRPPRGPPVSRTAPPTLGHDEPRFQALLEEYSTN